MSHTHTFQNGGINYTATVPDETNLSSPVTITSGGYTVTFDGNQFASKHLRRIRQASISSLTDVQTGPGKLTDYITEARQRSVERWDGRETSTNSVVFLDLAQYCQFGCQVIDIVRDAAIPWTPYGPHLVQQKHGTVSLGKCLAYSHSGTGMARGTAAGRVQGGVGIDLRVTISQVGGMPTAVAVCHYAGGDVKGKFKDEYGDKKDLQKRAAIARSIVT
jgi:hypothetical protein